jgi:phage recombination protein Bet
MGAIVEFKAVTDLAAQYGLDASAFITTVRAVAMPKDHTDQELVSCLLVAHEHGLNPLTKEIFFMRTRAGIQPIVSVDGWMRKCNEHPQFDGVEFEDVKDDNKIIAMTCKMFRKDRKHPIAVTEYLDECLAGGGAVWKTHPKRMLRNRSYCQAARMAFGFAGIMEPDEFNQWQANPDLQDPIDITPPDPRGGDQIDMRGETRKRPASGAFKDTGGAERFKELSAALEAAATVDELQKCFDAFCIDGTAWAAFPAGWARLLQEAYYHRKLALEKTVMPDEPDEQLADQDGFISAIEESLAAADTDDLIKEVIDCNADLIPRLSPANRLKVARLYQEAMQ